MNITPTSIAGAVLLEWPVQGDARGSFQRVADQTDLEAAGIRAAPRQWSLSRNTLKGTLRGIHFQWPPYEETKLVRCITGRVFDVLVDLRPLSPTRGQASHIELRADDGKTLYVPPGVAHGFLCLEDDTTLLYGIEPDYQPDAAHGVRWNDTDLRIAWPITPSVVSKRDQAWGNLADILKQMSLLRKTT